MGEGVEPRRSALPRLVPRRGLLASRLAHLSRGEVGAEGGRAARPLINSGALRASANAPPDSCRAWSSERATDARESGPWAWVRASASGEALSSASVNPTVSAERVGSSPVAAARGWMKVCRPSMSATLAARPRRAKPSRSSARVTRPSPSASRAAKRCTRAALRPPCPPAALLPPAGEWVPSGVCALCCCW